MPVDVCRWRLHENTAQHAVSALTKRRSHIARHNETHYIHTPHRETIQLLQWEYHSHHLANQEVLPAVLREVEREEQVGVRWRPKAARKKKQNFGNGAPTSTACVYAKAGSAL